MTKSSKILFLSIVLFCVISVESQCAMCRAVLESEESQSTAKGINDGILYLMAIPYVVVGGIGFFIFKNFRRKKLN